MSEAVTIAWISGAFGVLGLIIAGVFAYLNTQAKDKDKTLPVIPPIRPVEEWQKEVAELQEKIRHHQDVRARYREMLEYEQRKFLAAMDAVDRLTRQMRRHAPHVNPAEYNSPNGGDSEPRILPPK